jgi:hypothetical protein
VVVLLVSVTVLVGGCGVQRDTGSSATGVTQTGPSATASSSSLGSPAAVVVQALPQ